MTFTELKYLVSKGEGQHLEFKKKADHPEKIVRELVAFANAGGGTLLLGVEDDGHIPGLKFADEEAYVMEAAIAMYARPTIDYKLIRVKALMGAEVLLYRVADGKEKPYYWLADKEKQYYRAYIRSKDQSLQASKEMFHLLKFRPDPGKEFPFQFGPQEQLLFKYLSENEWIEIHQFAQLAGIPKGKASSRMIGWVKKGVLRIEPNQDADRFYLEDAYKSFKA